MTVYDYCLMVTQIIIESFPVSSSGHIALLMGLFRSYGCQWSCAFTQNVMFVLHIPTLCILALFFREQIFLLVRHCYTLRRIIFKMMAYAACSTVITLGWYGLFLRLGTTWWPLGLGFMITAFLLGSLRFIPDRAYVVFSFKHALILGCVQGCALLPGISRFGATFVVGRWLGLSARKSFYSSFMLQAPLLIPACIKGILSYQGRAWLSCDVIMVMIASSICAYYALRLNYYLAYSFRFWIYFLYLPLPAMLWLSLVVHR